MLLFLLLGLGNSYVLLFFEVYRFRLDSTAHNHNLGKLPSGEPHQAKCKSQIIKDGGAHY